MEPAPEHPGDQQPRRPSVERFHEMPVAAANHRRTILEYLDEDCWRAVLDYVPVADIIKSERVSRQWQQVMLSYLSHVRITVKSSWYCYENHHCNVSMSLLPCGPSFESWTYKLGPSLVAYHCDDAQDSLNIIGENCPNLEELRCSHLVKFPEPLNSNEYFRRLQKLCFYCCAVTDTCVSQFLASNDLEEIKILSNKSATVTGEFLTHLKSTKLKELVFKRCPALQITPLLSVATQLSRLTKLVLKRVPDETGWSAHLLLDKMPRLEYLYVSYYGRGAPDNTYSDKFYELVCGLSNLEYLWASYNATDRHIEAVMRGCTKLRTWYVCGGWCTERGMAALRGAGARLTGLYLPTSSHDHVVDCARACPNLTTLYIGVFLTRRLGKRIIAARRALSPPPPRLTIHTNENYDSNLYFAIKGNEDILYVPTREPQFDSDDVDEH